jgi:hypothetical protein
VSTSTGSDSHRYPVHPSFRIPEHAHDSPRTGGALATDITGAGGGGGGSAGPLAVTDGTTTVSAVSAIDFTSGATVTDLGGGMAGVAITGGGGGRTFAFFMGG